MKIPNNRYRTDLVSISLARIVSEDSQPKEDVMHLSIKSSKDS